MEINKNPSLACSISDILNISVGLITADEVVFAGGIVEQTDKDNTSYYLYTGQTYWTMSPLSFYYTGLARVLYVGKNGSLGTYDYVNATFGVRPVINLKADTLFTGTRTSADPYTVVYN